MFSPKTPEKAKANYNARYHRTKQKTSKETNSHSSTQDKQHFTNTFPLNSQLFFKEKRIQTNRPREQKNTKQAQILFRQREG